MAFSCTSTSCQATDAQTDALFKSLQAQVNRLLALSTLPKEDPGTYQKLVLEIDGKIGPGTIQSLRYVWLGLLSHNPPAVQLTPQGIAQGAAQVDAWLKGIGPAQPQNFAPAQPAPPATAAAQPPSVPPPGNVQAALQKFANQVLNPTADDGSGTPVPFYKTSWFRTAALVSASLAVIGLLWWGLRARFQHARGLAGEDAEPQEDVQDDLWGDESEHDLD